MRKSVFFILCLFHFLLSVFCGFFGKQFQFLIIGLAMLFFGFFLLNKNPFENKKIGYYIIFCPILFFYLINSLVLSLIYRNYNLLPFLFIIILSEAFVIYVFNKHNNKAIIFSLLFIILNGIGSYYIMNYYYFVWSKSIDNKSIDKNLLELNLIISDEHGEMFDINKLKGKISVIDIWASSCSICINGFPDYDKLKKEFIQDESLEFYSLNIHQRNDKINNVIRYTDPFKFIKLYTPDDGFKKIGINAVPKIMIIDRELKIRYIGPLLKNNSSLYNNFYSTINNIKNEYK